MNAASEPFAQLLAIANRSLQYAQGLPAQVEPVPEVTGIAFQLMGQRLFAPMGEITEIIHLPPATKLPGVKPWVRGVANVRGRLLPLFDMEAFLNGELKGSRKNFRVMALEVGELYSGLIVSQVYGMETFPADTFSGELPEGIEEGLLPYVAGSYHRDGKLWPVFSAGKLIEDARFFNVAA